MLGPSAVLPLRLVELVPVAVVEELQIYPQTRLQPSSLFPIALQFLLGRLVQQLVCWLQNLRILMVLVQ